MTFRSNVPMILSLIFLCLTIAIFINALLIAENIEVNLVVDSELINKAMEYHSVNSVYYDKVNGFWFVRNGQVCNLFNYGFVSENKAKIKEFKGE